jgi:hypothetical protein
LQTYGVYRWLADEELPELRAKLPGTNEQQRFSALPGKATSSQPGLTP